MVSGCRRSSLASLNHLATALSLFTHTFSSLSRRRRRESLIWERLNWKMSVLRTILLQCPSISHFSTSSSSPNPLSVKFTVSCCSVASPVTVVNGNVDKKPHERSEVRLGLPSKGRMATDTLDLLKVMYAHTNSIVQQI